MAPVQEHIGERVCIVVEKVVAVHLIGLYWAHFEANWVEKFRKPFCLVDEREDIDEGVHDVLSLFLEVFFLFLVFLILVYHVRKLGVVAFVLFDEDVWELGLYLVSFFGLEQTAVLAYSAFLRLNSSGTPQEFRVFLEQF